MGSVKHNTNNYPPISQVIEGSYNNVSLSYNLNQSSDFQYKSLIYHQHIDPILEKAAKEIYFVIDSYEFLDADNDYFPYEEKEVELMYFDINLYIKIILTNTSIDIEDVYIIDQEDNEYDLFANLLLNRLCKYFKKESYNIASTYVQSLEIKQDQIQSYGLNTDIQRVELLKESLYNISEQMYADDNLETKLRKIGEGKILSDPIKMKDGIGTADVVNLFIPIIDNGLFLQANKSSSNEEKAIFLHNCFGGNLLQYGNQINLYYRVV